MQARRWVALAAGLLLALRPAPLYAQTPAPDDDSLAGVLAECSELRLAEQALPIKDKTIKVGHLEIGLAEGTAVPVVSRGGSMLGLYFEGRGGYVYRTGDPADRAAMAANLARVSNTLRPVDDRVSDEFKQLLILFTDPRFAGTYAVDAAEPVTSQPLVSGFRTALAAATNSYGEFDFRVAETRLNGSGRWLYAEMSGGLDRVGYAYDELQDGRERLFGFRKLADYAVRFTETLSYQALPGWDTARRLRVVLTRADFDVATDDNRTGTINSELTYRIRTAGTRVLRLGLFNNRDPDTASWSSSHQKLVVKRVVGPGGKELPFAHKYDEILVEIPPTASPNANVTLRFETAGDVFVDMAWRHTDNYFTLGYTDWYPSPGWAGEQFTFHMKVRCKKPWRPVTSGRELSLKDDGAFVTAESESTVPSSLVTVFGGKYVTRQETIDGLTVRIHAYAMARKNVLDNMPKLAAAMVKSYSATLGPMPAEELDIVEIPEYGFGISPAGVILLTTEAYKPHQDEIANYLARGINARLAHEIAHQWFGHKLTPADTTDNWLSESFAEYFSGLTIGALAGNDQTIFNYKKMFLDWQAEDKYCADAPPIAVAPYLGGEKGRADRRCLLYYRGPLVLHMLRTSIGNERFFAVAKLLLDNAANGPASTDDFSKAMSQVLGADMSWFTDQWVRRSGNAVVDVEQHVEPLAQGWRLSGTIRQKPGAGFKKLVLPFVFDVNGKTESRAVFVEQPEQTFEFMLSAKPSGVKPDPAENNLATYK